MASSGPGANADPAATVSVGRFGVGGLCHIYHWSSFKLKSACSNQSSTAPL